MDGFDTHGTGGSLHISSDVIEKIARQAALEVQGVRDIPLPTGPKSLLGKISTQKAIEVKLKNDVAEIVLSIAVEYGTKIPELSQQVQENIKEAVQSMTSITVQKVDVIVAGIVNEVRAQ